MINLRTEEQRLREKALLRTEMSSYKRLKRNQVMFHEMRNKLLSHVVQAKYEPLYNVRLTITKNGI